jgi:hypothetical protein
LTSTSYKSQKQSWIMPPKPKGSSKAAAHSDSKGQYFKTVNFPATVCPAMESTS